MRRERDLLLHPCSRGCEYDNGRCVICAGAEPWTIRVCGACNLPVEACRCEPADWVGPSGEQLEPPSRPVRVQEVTSG